MCLALHPHNIGRPNAAKHLDEALSYILGHDGVWASTADDIAEYYLANYYDQVRSWIAEHNTRAPVMTDRLTSPAARARPSLSVLGNWSA